LARRVSRQDSAIKKIASWMFCGTVEATSERSERPGSSRSWDGRRRLDSAHGSRRDGE
jgi:hypothetical protein